ncbi:MAG TPA: type II secretion system F family protein [Acidiferrobacterales bacterium]|nr:type II secretion system F family protein [Acidiferrobacterales bacterium]
MHYQVKALRAPSGIVAITLDAQDEADAVRQAKTQGYTVLAVRRARAWRGLRFKKTGAFPLVLFSQELLALLKAGLTLVESMQALAEKEHVASVKRTLEQIIAHLYEGQPLSFALRQFPASFPALYVATVRASEKTGNMPEAMSRYIGYQTQMDFVRKKIISASIYPTLLLLAGGLVALFLMAYVIPKFSRIYEDVGGNLPWLSRLLLQWGQLLEAHGAQVFLAFVLVVAGLVYTATRPATRQWLVRELWRIPAVGQRMHIYQLARFYRTLGMLLRGGTPVVTALDMVSGLLMTALRDPLQRATHAIREGRSISESMEGHGLTTPVALRMLRVGERTGQMGEMMDRIAGFHDEEMARWVDWITKLIEPLLMVVIGLVIGVIVVLMYFPIFELAGSIQ